MFVFLVSSREKRVCSSRRSEGRDIKTNILTPSRDRFPRAYVSQNIPENIVSLQNLSSPPTGYDMPCVRFSPADAPVLNRSPPTLLVSYQGKTSPADA